MDHRLIEAIVDGVVPQLREYIDKQLAGLKGEKGDRGETGEQGPPGSDGADGKNGKDGVSIDGPIGPRGADGLNGKDGVDGLNGKDGTSGEDGADGKDGEPGRDGLPGVPGRDGKDGAPGTNGLDGLGFDDLDVTLGEDGRTVTFKFQQGERVKEFKLVFPNMIYRGVWQPGEYLKGDVVTWGGQMSIAVSPATTERPLASDDWSLAVRKGKDGRDLRTSSPAPAEPIRFK